MKIGILTFFRPINYGAVLQACATSNIVLPKIGMKAELIDYRLPRIEIYRQPFSLSRISRYNGISAKVVNTIKDAIKIPVRSGQNRLFDDFINKYLYISNRTYHCYEELAEYCQEYDAYIVGSDLVWSPLMTDRLDPAYFLGFISEGSNKKRIAYAPSIGSTNLTDEQRSLFAEYLKYLDCISVREQTSANMLQELTDKRITVVLDPTLLTVESDWENYYNHAPKFSNDYIFAFTLEDSSAITDAVNELARQYNCEIVATGTKKPYKAKKVTYLRHSSGPSDFLNIIKNARSVVTNSYHGCAFSLIFHKDFYCVPHSTRGVRMIDLMNSLNLMDRIANKGEFKIMTPICYDTVESKRISMAENSYNFLRDAFRETKL